MLKYLFSFTGQTPSLLWADLPLRPQSIEWELRLREGLWGFNSVTSLTPGKNFWLVCLLQKYVLGHCQSTNSCQ